MRMPVLRTILAVLVFLFALEVLYPAGQSPGPQVYTINATSMMTPLSLSGSPAELTISRRGPKEVVDSVIAPSPAHPKGIHATDFIDLQAHRVYMHNFTYNTCSWMNYVSAEMPNYDPLAAPVPASDLARQKSPGPPETINGIPAKAMDVATPPGQPKVRLWVAEQGHFPVKAEMTVPGGKPLTMLLVKKVSYDAPPQSFFVPPANCNTQAQGEMSSTGFSAHAEANVEAHVSASTDLKTGDTHAEGSARLVHPESGNKTAPVRSPSMGATEPNATYRVTDVRLRLVPASYTGPCPGHVKLVGEFTTNGPGTVWYRFLAGAVSNSPEGKVVFTQAGTKSVTIEGTFRSTPRVPQASLIAIMEDKRGNHGTLNLSSGGVDYNITCTEQDTPAMMKH